MTADCPKYFANFLSIGLQKQSDKPRQVVFFEKILKNTKKIAKSLDMGGGGTTIIKMSKIWVVCNESSERFYRH